MNKKFNLLDVVIAKSYTDFSGFDGVITDWQTDSKTGEVSYLVQSNQENSLYHWISERDLKIYNPDEPSQELEYDMELIENLVVNLLFGLCQNIPLNYFIPMYSENIISKVREKLKNGN